VYLIIPKKGGNIMDIKRVSFLPITVVRIAFAPINI
jgi:hypothetical protein